MVRSNVMDKDVPIRAKDLPNSPDHLLVSIFVNKRCVKFETTTLGSTPHLHRLVHVNAAWSGSMALSSTLIKMYKRNLLVSMSTHTLIHLKLFAHMSVSGFWA